ncbi:hypothetical protein [Bradyrhizobium sp. S3.9.1]|uniref:hypothetical protein n=1 Tax=Bradyrhizobium sp. S3.9.1 TaxID=3156431 RepID=UPI00339453DC
MLNARTLMVLGAGASYDFGMPLGEGLSKRIAEKVNIKFDFPNKLVSGNADLMQALRIRAQNEQCDVNLYRTAGCAIADGISYSRSIDSYLSAHEDNPYVKACGKLAIVQSILEAERRSDLWVDPARANAKFHNQQKVMQSWLSDFMYLLTSGIARAKNLDRVFENLAIVNFNYDRCIEQFFWYALQDLYQISETDAAELVRSKLKMVRPYGKVGELPMGGRGVPFGATAGPAQLDVLAADIRTFNEQVGDAELLTRVHTEIDACDRIIFLGFHFHKQNTDLLRPAKLSPADDRTTPRVCFGTATGRSGPDVEVIQNRVRAIFHQRLPSSRIEAGLDCKGIFRTYVTAWGA